MLWSVALSAPVALHPDAVFDPVDGRGRGYVLVDEGIIQDVVKKPPTGVTVQELPGLTLVPGYIDVHTHLLTRFTPRGGASIDGMVREPDAYRALLATRKAHDLLQAGFTTVRDLGNAGNYADTYLKRAINEGVVPGPDLLVSGRILSPFGGQTYNNPNRPHDHTPEYRYVDSVEDGVRAVRENLYYEADLIKVVVDPHTRYSWTAAELGAIVRTAHDAGVRVAAHVQTEAGAEVALGAGVDTIEHGWGMSDDQISRVVELGIPVCPTPFTAATWHRVPVERADKRAAHGVKHTRRLHDAGVELLFGTDLMDGPAEGWEDGGVALTYVDAYSEAGLSPQELLTSMTSGAAAALGLEDRGRIVKGQRADFVAVEGDPSRQAAALKQVRWVMKKGEVIRPLSGR